MSSEDLEYSSVDDNFDLSTDTDQGPSPRPTPDSPLKAESVSAVSFSSSLSLTDALPPPSTTERQGKLPFRSSSSVDQLTTVTHPLTTAQRPSHSYISPRTTSSSSSPSREKSEKEDRPRRGFRKLVGKHSSETFSIKGSTSGEIERAGTSDSLTSASSSSKKKGPTRTASALLRERSAKITKSSRHGVEASTSGGELKKSSSAASIEGMWTLGRSGVSLFDSLTVYRKDLDYVAEETSPLAAPHSAFYLENAIQTHTPSLWRKVSGFDWFRKYFLGRKYRFYIGSHEFIGVMLVIFVKEDSGSIRSMFFTESGIEAKLFSPSQLSKLGMSSIKLTKAQRRKWETKFLGRINGALASAQCTISSRTVFPLLETRLAELETFQGYTLNRTTTRFKVGVVYLDDSIDDEPSLFLASPSENRDYDEFLYYLGTILPIESSTSVYTGGLTSQNCEYFLHHQDVDTPVPEIAFHVNSWMKDPLAQTSEDRILASKRHIANDSVVIVFKTGTKKFDPTLIRSQYTQVYFVIEKQSPEALERSHYVSFRLNDYAAASSSSASASSSSIDSDAPVPHPDPATDIFSTPTPTPSVSSDATDKGDLIAEPSVHFASSSAAGDPSQADDRSQSQSTSETAAFKALHWDPITTKKQVKIFRVFLDSKRFKTVAIHLPSSFGELRVAVTHKCKGLGLDTSKFVICAQLRGAAIEPLCGYFSSWDIGSLIGHWEDPNYQLMFCPPSQPPDTHKVILERMAKSGHYAPAGIAQMYAVHTPCQQTRYRLTIVTKEGVSPWSPPFPPVTWFPADHRFKTFLIEKLAGAQLSCHLSAQWSQRFARSRKLLLEELANAAAEEK